MRLVDLEYQMIRLHGGGLAVWENNGRSWLAYRRRPEEASRMKHVCAATGGPCCWCNPGPCNSRKPESGDTNA